MSDKHIITREIGNIKGISTDSSFLRPPNVSEEAINLQKAPDETTQIRRGYQCQIRNIGGLGLGTFDAAKDEDVLTVTVGLDGFLYNKLTKQIYFYYDGQITGTISAITNADPAQVTSASHGLQSGAKIILRDINGVFLLSSSLNNKSYIVDVINVNNFDLYYLFGGKTITFASQTNPCVITSKNHGLTTGKKIMITGVNGMINLNNISYTVTFIDADNYSLNGVNATGFPAYISGGSWCPAVDTTAYSAYVSDGYWSILFADQRYLTFTIFTDPRYLTTNLGWSYQPWSLSPWGAPSGESITCNISVNRAAQVSGIQNNTNTLFVEFGHQLVATEVIQFYSSNGTFNQRNVLSVTPFSVTFDGFPVSVDNAIYISQFFDIPFRKGFDVLSPYLISTFIATITNPITGIKGLKVAINGDDNLAAAFLQIIEPTIIYNNDVFQTDYWYWQRVNSTINPPLPGSANFLYQNSKNFENASMAAYQDIIFIANGYDYPQKYDGQTIYRAGMPLAIRPSAIDNVLATIKPFSSGDTYQYAITYEQTDNRGNFVEGEISEIWNHVVGTTFSAIDVTVTNLVTTFQNNWNTNNGTAVGGAATSYGPDINGFYYNLVDLNVGFTLKIGDSAYYGDLTAAVLTTNQTDVITLFVSAGHAILPGDTVYFVDSSGVLIQTGIAEVTPVSITITGNPVSIVAGNVLLYIVSKVFGNVAIVSGNQSNVNTINVSVGYTIQLNDVVEFTDQFGRIQRRNVTGVGVGTVTVDGIPVDVLDKFLISSTNQRTNALNFQRLNSSPATLGAGAFISNNLRINIYRTKQGEIFGTNGNLYLVASIPNGSTGIQVFTDEISDNELGREFLNPEQIPNPPPICKYLRAFGVQMFYAGGEYGTNENSDRVFFSGLQDLTPNPEVVPLVSNAFNVPNTDDDITGIGVSGTSIITTKNHSIWAATGNFLTGQIEIVQIAPGSNIGCAAHASIASVGSLMYFLHTNGVYAITENQIYPTDRDGNPIPISSDIDKLFRENNFLPNTKYVLKRAVAINYTKDNQYLLFLPCEDVQSTIRTANSNSIILCYDYQGKNWYPWVNMNAAGGMAIIDDDLYFQERRFSGVDGNSANFYKQHRFYRLVDHADHAGAQYVSWKSSWTDLGQPEVRKKFCRCVLLMDRLSELQQYNNPDLNFSTYLNRIPNLQSTIAKITQVDNIRNSSWSYSGWGWNYWSGYQDSFIAVNLKQGTVAKSIQIGFTIKGINMDIRLAGFQIEAIPENRKSILR